jgi:two-component system chemotaxis response regulator CheY
MASSKKLTAIIADDENHIRVLIKTVLKSMGMEIVGEAKTGEEAIRLYKEKMPRMLFLDINMPSKTGEDALQEIMEEFPEAFVIMLSSVADRESVEKCIELGAVNYIRKDTPISEMKKMIKESWDEYRKM